MENPTACASDPLVRELARLRMSLAFARHQYAELLAVARAAVAAGARGDPNPLFWISDELAAHGQLPVPGAVPQQVAAAGRYEAA